MDGLSARGLVSKVMEDLIIKVGITFFAGLISTCLCIIMFFGARLIKQFDCSNKTTNKLAETTVGLKEKITYIEDQIKRIPDLSILIESIKAQFETFKREVEAARLNAARIIELEKQISALREKLNEVVIDIERLRAEVSKKEAS